MNGGGGGDTQKGGGWRERIIFFATCFVGKRYKCVTGENKILINHA